MSLPARFPADQSPLWLFDALFVAVLDGLTGYRRARWCESPRAVWDEVCNAIAAGLGQLQPVVSSDRTRAGLLRAFRPGHPPGLVVRFAGGDPQLGDREVRVVRPGHQPPD